MAAFRESDARRNALSLGASHAFDPADPQIKELVYTAIPKGPYRGS
jgi:hypothetical protein